MYEAANLAGGHRAVATLRTERAKQIMRGLIRNSGYMRENTGWEIQSSETQKAEARGRLKPAKKTWAICSSNRNT